MEALERCESVSNGTSLSGEELAVRKLELVLTRCKKPDSAMGFLLFLDYDKGQVMLSEESDCNGVEENSCDRNLNRI